uniref:InlB B-repeat-containing protein n=1 Tax=Candidatus Fimivicinus sp. TaxID=3056640 RepID=UPI003FEED57C
MALAILMILSSLPVVVFAAEKVTPEIYEWPTGTVEVGDAFKNAKLTGGSASVPGTFEVDPTQSGSPSRPGTAKRIGIFTPDDTESYESVKLSSAIVVTIVSSQSAVATGVPNSTEIKTGQKLGESILSRGEMKVQSYTLDLTSRIDSINWSNPEEIMNEAGTFERQAIISFQKYSNGVLYAEPITVSVPVTVISAETIAQIEEEPTVPSVTYREGLKVGDLELVGGKANVEGTFSFAQPDRALFVGESIPVEVVFTPADTSMKPVSLTVNVTVEKGDIVVTEAPIFTFVYQNTPLKNRSVLHNAVIEGGVIEPSAVTWDWYDEGGLKVKDPQANLALGVGNYQIEARATAKDSRNFNIGFFTVNVVIKADETKAFPLQADLEGNELRIKANGYYAGKGKVTYTVNGTVVAENTDPKAEVVYAIPDSGDYTVKAEYTPAEHDNYIYKPATQTVKAVLPRTVTVNGGSGSGSYKPGQTVKVEFDQTSLRKYYEFKGWKITNAEGETVDVGVEDLTQTSISFTMPDEDVTVKATTSFSIQLFFKSIGDTILAFLMKVVEWIMGLFNGLGSLS